MQALLDLFNGRGLSAEFVFESADMVDLPFAVVLPGHILFELFSDVVAECCYVTAKVLQ